MRDNPLGPNPITGMDPHNAGLYWGSKQPVQIVSDHEMRELVSEHSKLSRHDESEGSEFNVLYLNFGPLSKEEDAPDKVFLFVRAGAIAPGATVFRTPEEEPSSIAVQAAQAPAIYPRVVVGAVGTDAVFQLKKDGPLYKESNGVLMLMPVYPQSKEPSSPGDG